MSEKNRIIDLNQPQGGEPVKIAMENKPGMVTITFDPGVMRMKLRPREARALAVSMLIHADQADCPPPIIEAPAT